MAGNALKIIILLNYKYIIMPVKKKNNANVNKTLKCLPKIQ